MNTHPLIIAHRGASREAPENTLSAIKRALALGVDFVEIDIRLSKDGIPIVLHDPSATRMMGRKAPPVSALTLNQIKSIELGRHFGAPFSQEGIPTLAEVLHLDWKQTGLMIEIKKTVVDPKRIVEAVFQVLTAIKTSLPRLVIGSFSLEIIQEIQKNLHIINSPIHTIGIVENAELIPSFIQLQIKHLAIWHKLVTWELAYMLREKDVDVWAFTVDKVEVAKFLISLGINGIISNDPKKMIESGIFHLH